MVAKIRFDGRVAIVTGAGDGLGRACALEFARRGARVIVNDQGCSLQGQGCSKSPADSTVALIAQAGGMAIPCYEAAHHGENIIKAAISAFGRVDIIINSASILVPRSIASITESDWDKTLEFNLKSTFSLTRAAWSHFRTQKFGRIINSSSVSGFHGSQAHFSSAVMGIHGFTQALSKEGEKYNIKANTVLATLSTHLTPDLNANDLIGVLSPEKVLSIVMCLAHESCPSSGSLFESAGGWFSRMRWQRGKGAFFVDNFSPEDISSRWKEINGFEECDYPKNGADTLQKVLSLMEAENFPKI